MPRFSIPIHATLVIAETDGSLVIPAGVALTSESGPVNGVIDPGETVTLLFALRNANGTNTVNLVATLLATTTASPIPADRRLTACCPRTARRPRGRSPSPPAARTAKRSPPPCNSRMASTALSNAVFNFTLGKTPASFYQQHCIIINDIRHRHPVSVGDQRQQPQWAGDPGDGDPDAI